MSLDFHIAKSERVIGATVDIVLSLEFETHQAFFREDLSGRLPMISRIEDFYSDCRFAGREIEALRSEISELLEQVQESPPHYCWLTKLATACSDAIECNETIFVLSD